MTFQNCFEVSQEIYSLLSLASMDR
jgi:hypothetical protein